MPRALFQIRPVRSADDLKAAVELFEAYASSLGIDLSYQDFTAEMAAMPGKYAPPAGELLLARDIHGEPLECVGLRPPPPDGCCEMKRLYVSPRGRGLGLGRALIEALGEQWNIIQSSGLRSVTPQTPIITSAMKGCQQHA